MSYIDLMGKETYELLYKHHDHRGNPIDDFEDVLLSDDEDIDQSKVEKLKKLLKPASNAGNVLVPLEAAKLLAAWGIPEALDYFDYCIDNRIDKLGNLSPHRLHGYDQTYEEIEESLLNYYSRCADRSEKEGNQAAIRIQSTLTKIIRLSKEISYNMMGLIKEIKNEGWRVYESDLKECFIAFLNKEKKDRNDYWNIQDLKILFKDWDPLFLKEVENKYGVIVLDEKLTR